MHLSCLPVSFFSDIIARRMSVGEWAHLAAAAGLDGVDLSILFVPDRSPQAVAVLRQEIEAASIQVTLVTSYPDFTHPDPAQREKELALEQEFTRTSVRHQCMKMPERRSPELAGGRHGLNKLRTPRPR